MSYSGVLFKSIPYSVKNSKLPIYVNDVVEHALLDFYDNKKDVIKDVISVYHDDTHKKNVIKVSTRTTNEDIWFGSIEDSACLKMRIDPNAKSETNNIVKSVCNELDINKSELSDITGISEKILIEWSKNCEVPEWGINFLNLFMENKKLKKKLKKFKTAFNLIDDARS